jgi:Tol biopolymer transport system component
MSRLQPRARTRQALRLLLTFFVLFGEAYFRRFPALTYQCTPPSADVKNRCRRPSTPPPSQRVPCRELNTAPQAGKLKGMTIRWMSRLALAFTAFVMGSSAAAQAAPGEQAAGDTNALAAEVRTKGWIIYGARSTTGDYDLFRCRPDGSDIRPLTRTPDLSEFSPLISLDGRKLLYRRVPKAEKLDNNRHGEQGELAMSDSDGSNVEVLGKPGEFTWASWSPDGKQIACLSIKGIYFVDLATRKVLRTIPRKGFFQQTTWSPDGKSICGVANSYGAAWSVARMDVSTGEGHAINTVDCCTPDWFPDSQQIIFSWRPRGQKANNGYGWTQLWRADAKGTHRELVYAEEGRHVYGGYVSPDGQYVIFTGNMHEDGDPGNAGAPMGLMRLKDGPIIAGPSPEFRAQHPNTRSGPVLTLPAGWEPCWTAVDIGQQAAPRVSAGSDTAALAAELHSKGRVAFSAKSPRGDWDLFLMRPDGSEKRQLTDTPAYNEAGVRFSPNGKQMLYYRLPASQEIDNNTYGTFELVVAKADGTEPVSYGNGFPWASWGPDGRQIACLTAKGIQIVDLGSRKVLKELPRKGIVGQLVWSPDGKRFTGTANGLGAFWNIGCLDIQSGQIKSLSETERYNCTPDWMPDSHHVLYARGIIPEQPGRAELWISAVDEQTRRRIYAEDGRHIYGACSSPDGKYVIFTRSVEDLGKVPLIEMAVMRLPAADTPGGARSCRLDLGPGWEPHWTAAETR